MKKKTALDYLNEEILKFDITPSDKNELLIFRSDLIKLIEIAKEIENKQIFDAFEIGNTLGYDGIRKDGMKYLNDNFK